MENNVNTNPLDKKTITLPSGKTAVIEHFKGKHVRTAQQIADGDSTKILFALIAQLTTIDGEPVVMEDLDEMHGPDVMKLMAEFSEANF
jgi:hypothetical protein